MDINISPLHLKKLDQMMGSIFGRRDLVPPRITYNFECRNPVAFDKIRALVNDWSDAAAEKAGASGSHAPLIAFPDAYIEESGRDNILFSFGDPTIAVRMFTEIGDTIRQIRRDYPPIARSVARDELTSFDRASLLAKHIRFDEPEQDSPFRNRPSLTDRDR